MALVSCPECGKGISGSASACPNCGHPMEASSCPSCGSPNIQPISQLSKAISADLWGPFASKTVSSTYKCKTCGHKF